MTFKLVVKTIAKRHGLHATFMPKPKYNENGSGMHMNMSLHNEAGENVFNDKNDPNGMSKEAYYFIGGLMKHIKAMTFITNPIVNSYKRFVPGFEAPVHIAWSRKNRTPLIRIPADRGGTSESNFVVRILQQTLIWHWQYVWQQDWTVSVVRSCHRTASTATY